MSVYKNEIAYEITAVDDKNKFVDVKLIDGTDQWMRIELARMKITTLEALDEAVRMMAPPVEQFDVAENLDLTPFTAAIGKGRIVKRHSSEFAREAHAAAIAAELDAAARGEGAPIPMPPVLADEAAYIRQVVREVLAEAGVTVPTP